MLNPSRHHRQRRDLRQTSSLTSSFAVSLPLSVSIYTLTHPVSMVTRTIAWCRRDDDDDDVPSFVVLNHWTDCLALLCVSVRRPSGENWENYTPVSLRFTVLSSASDIDTLTDFQPPNFHLCATLLAPAMSHRHHLASKGKHTASKDPQSVPIAASSNSSPSMINNY